MKKTLIALLILLTAGTAFAQKNAVDSYFQDHSNNEAFTKITISDVMFQLANYIEVETQEEKEFKEAVSKIRGMVILVCDSCAGNERSMYYDSNKRLPKSFEELMLVEDKDAEVRFAIKEDKGTINEMVVTIGGDDVFVLVDIWGEIDLRNVRKLTEAFDVKGMDSFDPKTAIASRSVNFYPNPVRQGENGKLDLPDELIGSVVKIYSLDGKLLNEFQTNSSRTSIPLSQYEGSVIINLFDGNKRFYTEKIILVR